MIQAQVNKRCGPTKYKHKTGADDQTKDSEDQVRGHKELKHMTKRNKGAPKANRR